MSLGEIVPFDQVRRGELIERIYGKWGSTEWESHVEVYRQQDGLFLAGRRYTAVTGQDIVDARRFRRRTDAIAYADWLVDHDD